VESLFGRPERVPHRLGDAGGHAPQLRGTHVLAAVAACRGEDVRAAQLWGVTAGITEAMGYALGTAEQAFHDELVPEVRARLGESAFDAAWHLGRQRSFEEALAFALRRS